MAAELDPIHLLDAAGAPAAAPDAEVPEGRLDDVLESGVEVEAPDVEVDPDDDEWAMPLEPEDEEAVL